MTLKFLLNCVFGSKALIFCYIYVMLLWPPLHYATLCNRWWLFNFNKWCYINHRHDVMQKSRKKTYLLRVVLLNMPLTIKYCYKENCIRLAVIRVFANNIDIFYLFYFYHCYSFNSLQSATVRYIVIIIKYQYDETYDKFRKSKA